MLLIELAVLESQVNAFTIQRIQGTNDSEPDLIESESALQTKSDVTPNDVKVIDIKHDGIQKIVPIETTAKTEDIKKSVGTSERATTHSSTASNSDYEEEEETVSSSVSTSSTTEEEDVPEVTSSKTMDVQHTTLSQPIKSSTNGNESASITTTSATTTILSSQPDVTTPKVVGIEVTNVPESTTKEVQPETTAATNSNTSVKIPIQKKNTITSTREARDDITSTTTQITKQSMYYGLKTTEDMNTTTAENMTTNETVKETDKSTESLTGEQSSVTVVPYWKKYTVIERKRISVTTEEDTVTSTEKEELVPAGSAQSSVSLEKAFSITSDIPSLEKLKNDLLERTNKLSSTENAQEIDTSTPTSSETSSTMSTDTNNRTNRIEVVSSKRAGFLDLSSRSTAPDLSSRSTEEATTESITETTKGVTSTTLKITATTGIPQLKTTLKEQLGEKINKKEPGMESQSQLVRRYLKIIFKFEALWLNLL